MSQNIRHGEEVDEEIDDATRHVVGLRLPWKETLVYARSCIHYPSSAEEGDAFGLGTLGRFSWRDDVVKAQSNSKSTTKSVKIMIEPCEESRSIYVICPAYM